MSHLPATNLDCEREFAQLKRIDPHTHARHLSLLTAVSLVDSEDTACSTATAGGAQNRRATCKVRRLQRQQPSQKQEEQHICRRSSASWANSRGERKDSTVGTEAKVVTEEELRKGETCRARPHTHIQAMPIRQLREQSHLHRERGHFTALSTEWLPDKRWCKEWQRPVKKQSRSDQVEQPETEPDQSRR